MLKEIIDSLRNGTVPSEGTENIAVGINEELLEIQNQIDVTKQDKSAFKFIIGDYGSGKTFFSTAIREMAYDKKFVVSSVVISQETPLHKFEELYRKIMDGMRTSENKKIPAFTFILEEWLLNIEDKVIEIEEFEDSEQFQVEMNKRINEELLIVGSIAASFANAIRAFYKAKYEGDTVLAQGAVAWLKGENIRVELKKKLGVTGTVTRENSFEFFRALLHMIKTAGYDGLMVILDEVETVQQLIRKDMRSAAYENLRFFIDESDKNTFPNCFFLYTGTTDLLESEKGFKSLEPLYQRIKVERDKDDKFKNLRQPIMFLDGFNREKLLEVACKVRNIHGQVYSWMPNDKVNDEFIDKLINDMTLGFGGEISIGPRGFLRTFIDILDKSQMYDEYIPSEQFEFNEEVKNMFETVENETAHIVNF